MHQNNHTNYINIQSSDMKLFFQVSFLFFLLSVFSCTKDVPSEQIQEEISFDQRDSIIGTYEGMLHYYDQNYIVGNEIDTMYNQTYEVIKFGIDSIKITPQLPIYYSEIPNEYFMYKPSNEYSSFYSTTYTSYSLNLEFKPDSLLMIFRTSFAVGLDYDNHSYNYRGNQ